MYCSACGTELPKDANFCYRCGKPVKQNAQAKVEWEYCQIEWDEEDGWGSKPFWFWAKAVGPDGVYSAGEPFKRKPSFIEMLPPESSNPKVQEMHEQLVEKLIKDGWEIVPERGNAWWQLRLRRTIKT